MRVAIIGNSGSGKSTLARQLATQSDIPILDLDTVAWAADMIAVRRAADVAHADVTAFCASHASWVVEGCYADLIAATLQHSPHLLFLDPGVEACLSNCNARPWEPHKYKSQAEQDQHLAFLLTWVVDYYQRDGDMSHAAHRALFDSYAGPKQHLIQLPRADFTLSAGV